jgi:beta-galactosidase/beta-glucuronidase
MEDTATQITPRPEHPRPQFFRPDWLSLNGRWEFEFDPADSGLERGLVDRPLTGSIIVPFAPESTASGIGDVDFHEAVWYRREIVVPRSWPGQRVHLHFQAVDHDATAWVNGVEVGRHRGGFTPFSFDITEALSEHGSGSVVVRARDPRDGPQARGKQARQYANSQVTYTRTTGIWQSVWLESVPATYFTRPRITPDVPGSIVEIDPQLAGDPRGLTLLATLSDVDGVVATETLSADGQLNPRLRLAIPAERLKLWSTDAPHLYDIELLLRDGEDIVDRVTSYVGMRSISVFGNRVLINGQPVFQRLVLDQGYWPDTLMTAPSDDALVTDIELARDAGFIGARIHQRVAEERFLYHADRLGFILWGEFADWGIDGFGPEGANQKPTIAFVTQWIEAIRRDYSHPSIVGWCPLNETHQLLHDRITDLDDVTAALFWATKSFDLTRPVIDASGYSHRVASTDVWDSHDYEQDPTLLAENYAHLLEGNPFINSHKDGRPYSIPYAGQPFMVSEFGGTWWNPDTIGDSAGHDRDASWGYGEPIGSEAEFYGRFRGLIEALLSNPDIFGYCYTQLTDTFQEQNGIYRFDRTRKLDVERLRQIQMQATAYEATHSELLEVQSG